MRKKNLTLLGLSLIALLFGGGAARAVIPADVNGDTLVTSKDVIAILRVVVRLGTFTEAQMDAGDIAPKPGRGPKEGRDYGDGKIDIHDALEAIRCVLNPATNLPPTFANVQRQVFNKSCAFSSCHSAQGRRGNLILEEGQAYEQLVNVSSLIDEGKAEKRMRVAPGKADASFLMTKLTHPGPEDGEKMPMGTETGLAPDKIDLVKKWILNGAQKDGDFTPLPPPDNQNIPIDPNFDENGDVQLEPPPPGKGVQMVIPAFDVPVGKEIQRNYYMKLPTDTDVYINKIEFAFNPGSHHLNIFKSDTEDLPEGTYNETFSAIAWTDWYLVVDSQNGSLGWKLPEGVAIHLQPRQQMNFQIHYVNIGDQRTRNNRGKAIVNFWFAERDKVTATMGALFAQNRTIALPPNSFSDFTKVLLPFKQDMTILAITGHFHGKGILFTVNKHDGLKAGEEVYRSQSWGDPPFTIYEKPFTIKAGESLTYSTYYFNPTDKIVKFGAEVDKDEHANLFVFFYPAPPDEKAIYDF